MAIADNEYSNIMNARGFVIGPWIILGILFIMKKFLKNIKKNIEYQNNKQSTMKY